MARKVKMTISFQGFEEYAEKLDKFEGSLKATVTEALRESADYVTKNLEKDIKPHSKPISKYSTGATAKSLKMQTVKWEGSRATIGVGFDISGGGLPSIFLMYGTPRHGPHPGVEADKALYKDAFGNSTKRKINEIQKEIFERNLKKRLGD